MSDFPARATMAALMAASLAVHLFSTSATAQSPTTPGGSSQSSTDRNDPDAPATPCWDCPIQVLPGAGANWQEGSPRPRVPCTVQPAIGTRSFRGNIWPNGVVPYQFASNVNSSERSAVLAAMAEWENVAPVSFVPFSGQGSWIFIQDANVNSSAVGRIGGRQTINIFNFNVRMIIAHELCHALGFYHTQSRPDRDTYVTILTQNIQSGASFNFSKQNGTSTLNEPYDFQSIMHYSQFAFTANGSPTILCNPGYTQFQNVIGQRNQLSTGDIAMMQAAYGPLLAPTLTGISPSSGSSHLPPRVSLFGTDMDTVSEVFVDSTPAAFTIISDTQLDFTPPNPFTIGTTTVTVVNATGTSNGQTYTVTGNDPAVVEGTSFLVQNLSLPFTCHTDVGKGAVLFASIFDTPSAQPGIVSLDIGGNFAFLLEVGGPALADATGTVNWSIPIPTGLPVGLNIYLQAVVFDAGNTIYPVPASANVFQTQVLF